MFIDNLGNQVITDSDNRQQEEVKATTLVIEIVGEECDEYQSCRCLLFQKEVDKRETQKEEEKQRSAEDQWLITVIGQLMQQRI